MRKSTFKLTKHELDFISDPQWMSLKQKLIRNISDSLHGLGQWLIKEYYPNADQNYKVTRGENYQDMPYVVLDTPQLKTNELAGKLRIMFWWGHYVSLQLFLHAHTIKQGDLIHINSGRYRILTGNNLFNNDLNSADFTLLDQQIIMELNPDPQITKICMKISLSEMDNIEEHIRIFMNDMSLFRTPQNA